MQVASLQEEIETLTQQLVHTGGDDLNPSTPLPDGIWDCFQVCRQADAFSDQQTANATTLGRENKVQALPTAYRDAIDRLEHALFSDFTNDGSSWEELPLEVLGEFAL